MHLIKKLYNPWFLLLAGLITSCSAEDKLSDGDEGRTITVVASIKGSGETESRANVEEMNHDGWSNSSFTSDDKMGFYSEHGDYYKPLGEDQVINLELDYKGNNQFLNPNNFVFAPSRMSASTIFMYYPYSQSMTDSEGLSENAPGMKLRIENDGIEKCVDFLDNLSIDAGALGYGVLTGTFQHAFSELIIMRGEGFNEPPEGKEEIWVVMQNPFTHVKINYSLDPSWSCYPELVYNENSGLSQEDAKRWQAWRGGNYTQTEQDPEGVPAWYVLLPCIGQNNSRYTVEYIELYDNDGNLQKVTSLSLAPRPNDNKRFTKILNEGKRYPLVVEMKELVPTINPYPITPWEGDTDFTNERKRGIETAFDFKAWRTYYMGFIADGEYENELLKYGDKIVNADGDKLYWHFYLLDNINLNEIVLEDEENDGTNYVILPELNDILDGVNMNEMENNVRPNFSITGLGKTLVGTMSGYGALQNIDFENPQVRIETTPETTAATGILVNQMTSGSTIDNCNINYGSLFSPGPVGFVAGSIENATISNCSVNGFMVGQSTLPDAPYLYMIGNQSGNNTLENNESNVVFETY